MKRAIYLLFSISIFLLSGCNSPKSLYKKGVKMEAAQLNKEASSYYYQALVKKREYAEAREALYRTGGSVLSNKLSVFFTESQVGNSKKAIDAYLDAEAYKKSLENVSVNLNIPPQYTQDFNELKKVYLLELYEQGLVYLDQEDYDSAELVFREIVRLEPDYKDTKKLKDIAYIEPFYRKGISALEENKYRSSYNAFLEVLSINPKYKDSEELQEIALKAGMVNIGLIHFENATQFKNAQKKIEAYNLDALVQTKDPFLKVIDRTNYEQLLTEQKINLSGAVDESTASEAGKLLGVKWLLGGTLLEINKIIGKPEKVKKTGYKSYKVKKVNEEGDEYYETQYKRTVYYEYKQKNSVNVSVQIKLISLTTGEIELSKILNKEVSDYVNYYIYDGEDKNLYPSEDGKVVTSRSAKKKLDQKLQARKEIKSVGVLSNDALLDVSKQVKNQLEKFSYNYVK